MLRRRLALFARSDRCRRWQLERLYGWREAPNISHHPTDAEADEEVGAVAAESEAALNAWHRKYASALMYCCASVSGSLNSRQRAWIAGYVDAMTGNEELVQLVLTYQPTAQDLQKFLEYNFTGRLSLQQQQCHTLIYDAVCAASADGVLGENEKANILAIGQRLNVREAFINKVFLLVGAEADLTRRKVSLLKTQFFNSLHTP
eukprot:TRINITY_DN20485_c0_g1_i1.p1 TRINITY_DN20485_c0_g1~~TRINITY_DN20485_c0_g1_i1.p1  ORF type:complete len:212 (-),score=41.85 TRINITY_DN20485_c0_g1_i1:37-648(-)